MREEKVSIGGTVEESLAQRAVRLRAAATEAHRLARAADAEAVLAETAAEEEQKRQEPAAELVLNDVLETLLMKVTNEQVLGGDAFRG